jgi:hypothetical protein
MPKLLFHSAVITRIIITVVVAFTGRSIAQTADSKKVKTRAAWANTQTVDHRRSGGWTLVIDPAKDVISLAKTTDLLPVALFANNAPGRQNRLRTSTNMPSLDGGDKQ